MTVKRTKITTYIRRREQTDTNEVLQLLKLNTAKHCRFSWSWGHWINTFSLCVWFLLHPIFILQAAMCSLRRHPHVKWATKHISSASHLIQPTALVYAWSSGIIWKEHPLALWMSIFTPVTSLQCLCFGRERGIKEIIGCLDKLQSEAV